MFAQVPMNFLADGGSADVVMTGTWSDKALSEARALAEAREAGTGMVDGAYVRIPTQAELDLSPDARYVHITTNNTVVGTQFRYVPDTAGVPLVADMSSDIMSAPIDVSKFGLIYAGAQKNLGPSGVVMVIAERSFLESASEAIPSIWRFATHAAKDSLLHTPPTFSIYLVRNVLDWLVEQGGLTAIAERNRVKAETLYGAIDASGGFYRCPVHEDARSSMNVVFRLPSEALEEAFLAEAADARLIGLRGHRIVGGIRASIYNAVSVEGVERLVALMERFRKTAPAA